MKNKRTAAVTLALALITALLSLPARAGNWIKLESDHFTITTDGPERRTREAIRQLEAFRSLSLQLLGADATSARAQVKFDVYMLKRKYEMQRVRPEFNEQVAGVYFHCNEGAAAYAEMEDGMRPNGTDTTLDVVRHEYSHHLMYQYARSYYPMWYVEGFAEFLSTATTEDGRISLGEPPVGRTPTLRSQVGWIDYAEVLKPTFKYAGASNVNVPLVQSFYAQSWLLTHYMLADGDRTRKLNAYFERLGKGEDPVAAFEPATGIPVDKLSNILWKYLDNMNAFRIPAVEPDPASIKVTALPDSANAYLLNAALLKTCVGKPQGEDILQQLRAADADANANAKSSSPELRLARARAEILFGDTRTALGALEGHAEDETSFEAHYLRGRALWKTAQTLKGEEQLGQVREAKSEFLKAYKLKKLDAPNFYFMAQSMAREGVNSNVVNAMRGARALAPNVYDYAIGEAFVDIEVGDRDRAVLALAPLASEPHDQAAAAKARATIEAIKAGKSRAEINAVWKETTP